MAVKRARPAKPVKPVNAALARLLALAAKGVVPLRMAREVEGIVAEWQAMPEAEPYEIKERLSEMHEQLVQGVADAEIVGGNAVCRIHNRVRYCIDRRQPGSVAQHRVFQHIGDCRQGKARHADRSTRCVQR